jgi:plastocyanin
MIFGMSQHEVRVAPCTRLTVTFVNRDQVRHQWMVHGLPKYLYPTGMFHLEANAGQRVEGTFIAPADDRTYLIHCDMAQHMEKGMKGQLVVGRGSGDLWSVKGVGDAFYRNAYLPTGFAVLFAGVVVLGLLAALRVLRSR